MTTKEGFKEGSVGSMNNQNSEYYELMDKLFANTRYSINKELGLTDQLEYDENRNYMLELLAQKENIASNVLMDYMMNDNRGSNVKKIYNKINQENIDKKRKTQITNYYTKTYMDYSNILKIIIFLVAIMIGLLLLTNNGLLDKMISLTAIVIILFLGFLYILYRLYLLYMKDNINFDKDRIPYDRKAGQLMNQGKLSKKGLGFGVTCIGEECCTDGMMYDSTKHRCFPDPNKKETFTNIEQFTSMFEEMNKLNNKQVSTVHNNTIHEDSKEFTYVKEPFVSDKSYFKLGLLKDSLQNSTPNNFYFSGPVGNL